MDNIKPWSNDSKFHPTFHRTPDNMFDDVQCRVGRTFQHFNENSEEI